MIKMIGVLAFACVGIFLISFIAILLLVCFVTVLERIFSTLKVMKRFCLYEKINAYIYRSRKDLNSHHISETIKLLWNLEEVYLVPIPFINIRYKNTAIVSSFKIRNKLSKLK